MSAAAGAAPVAPGTDAGEVLDGIVDMYDAFIARDRARFDSHLDADVSTWETPLPRMMTRAELDSYRDDRPAAVVERVLDLRVEPQRVDAWGDVAVARYLLAAVRSEAVGDEISRVTDVLRRGPDGAWRIVHHHSELWAPHGAAAEAPTGSAGVGA